MAKQKRKERRNIRRNNKQTNNKEINKMGTYITDTQAKISYFVILPIMFATSWISKNWIVFWGISLFIIAVYLTIKGE
jgi:hypothetical protein